MEVKEFLPGSSEGGYNGVNPNGDVVFVDGSEVDCSPFQEVDTERRFDEFCGAKLEGFTERNDALLGAMKAAGAFNRDIGATRSGRDIVGVGGAENRAVQRRQEALSLARQACENCPLFDFCPTAGKVPEDLLFNPEIRKRVQLRVSGGKARDLSGNNMLCETNMKPGRLGDDIPVL